MDVFLLLLMFFVLFCLRLYVPVNIFLSFLDGFLGITSTKQLGHRDQGEDERRF